jgi:antitoxin component YwqK of YwqJK toxin-antitoxin module
MGANADYVGFSHETDQWLFKARYYRLRGDCGYGTGVVRFSRFGFNPFEAHYPNGALLARGFCRVYPNGQYGLPVADFENCSNAEYFKPDGTAASKIVDGSGTETLFYLGGKKYWELDLREGKRARLRLWYENGQIKLEESYRDGLRDGPYMTFYQNSVKRREGINARDHSVGRFSSYSEDGALEDVEVFDPAGKLLARERYKDGKLVGIEKP